MAMYLMLAFAFAVLPEKGITTPNFAQIEHSASLAPVAPEYLAGRTFIEKSASSVQSPGWSRIPPKLAGRWKLVKMQDNFTDTFDLEKQADLPTVNKKNTHMLLGLQQDANGNVWDSEDLNKTQLDRVSQINLIDKWQINFASDHSMSMMQQRTSLEINTADSTVRKVYLSETIVDFELNSANKLEAKVSTKWFTPEGEALAISRSTREYKRLAPFKNVNTLNSVDLKTSFDAFLQKRIRHSFP